jgi:hypothetical protein
MSLWSDLDFGRCRMLISWRALRNPKKTFPKPACDEEGDNPELGTYQGTQPEFLVCQPRLIQGVAKLVHDSSISRNSVFGQLCRYHHNPDTKAATLAINSAVAVAALATRISFFLAAAIMRISFNQYC